MFTKKHLPVASRSSQHRSLPAAANRDAQNSHSEGETLIPFKYYAKCPLFLFRIKNLKSPGMIICKHRFLGNIPDLDSQNPGDRALDYE